MPPATMPRHRKKKTQAVLVKVTVDVQGEHEQTYEVSGDIHLKEIVAKQFGVECDKTVRTALKQARIMVTVVLLFRR